MNNCHLWILKIYQVDIRNIHYPWYIDGIRKIYSVRKNIRYRILRFLHSVLPYVYDHLRGKTRSSIVICVSTLNSLMMDQVKKYSVLGLAIQFVGQAQEDPSVTRGVLPAGFYES